MWPFPMESAHPLVVHFPIALLLSALVLDGSAVVFKRPTLHRVALWNLSLGILGAGAAVWTGYRAAGVAKHSFEIHQVMELHRKLGIATLLLAALVLGWRLWTKDRLGLKARVLTLLILSAMAATLAYGAHQGGRLVYEFGVGGAFGRGEAPADHAHDHHH